MSSARRNAAANMSGEGVANLLRPERSSRSKLASRKDHHKQNLARIKAAGQAAQVRHEQSLQSRSQCR